MAVGAGAGAWHGVGVLGVNGWVSFEPYVVQAKVLEGVSEEEKEVRERCCRKGDAVELEAAERGDIASGDELVDGAVSEPAGGRKAEFLQVRGVSKGEEDFVTGYTSGCVAGGLECKGLQGREYAR